MQVPCRRSYELVGVSSGTHRRTPDSQFAPIGASNSLDRDGRVHLEYKVGEERGSS